MCLLYFYHVPSGFSCDNYRFYWLSWCWRRLSFVFLESVFCVRVRLLVLWSCLLFDFSCRRTQYSSGRICNFHWRRVWCDTHSCSMFCVVWQTKFSLEQIENLLLCLYMLTFRWMKRIFSREEPVLVKRFLRENLCVIRNAANRLMDILLCFVIAWRVWRWYQRIHFDCCRSPYGQLNWFAKRQRQISLSREQKWTHHQISL